MVASRVIACLGDVLADWFLGENNDEDSSNEDAGAGFDSLELRCHDMSCAFFCAYNTYIYGWLRMHVTFIMGMQLSTT